MSFIKEDLEDSSNMCDFDLQAVKIELDEIKFELPHEIEINTITTDQQIHEAYVTATNRILVYFYHIMKFYRQKDLPNYGTYHLDKCFLSYHTWNEYCRRVLHKLNIPSNFNNRRISYEYNVTLRKIRQHKRIMENAVKYLSDVIHVRDAGLAEGFDQIFGILQDAVQILHLTGLPQADVPFPTGPIGQMNNPLTIMVQQHFPEYHGVLYT